MTAVVAPPARTRTRTPNARVGAQPARRSGTQPARKPAARSGTQPARKPAVRSTTPPARKPATTRAQRRARVAVRQRSRVRVGVGVFVVGAALFVFVSAVLFHVLLAQGQLQLDRLGTEITAAQRDYEQLRLQTSTLGSPPRVIEEAQRQGLVIPSEPATHLEVPGAKVLSAGATSPSAGTLDEWQGMKANVGRTGP
jgi:cell division protein FtsL